MECTTTQNEIHTLPVTKLLKHRNKNKSKHITVSRWSTEILNPVHKLKSSFITFSQNV
jgi:hypothetical protein